MGFTKLDEGIIKSSIMREDSDTFKVWVALLACCGHDSIARVAPTYISGVCYLPLEAVVRAFDKFQAPDPFSRNPEHEGRRIKQVKGGWKILNYKYYRRFLYSSDPAALRQRRHREKDKKRDMSRIRRDISASASASDKQIKEEDQERLRALFEAWWKRYPRHEDKGKAIEKWMYLVIVLKVDPQTLEDALTGYIRCLKSHETDREYVKYAKTFLNPGNEKKKIPGTWEQYVPYAADKYKPRPPL